MDIRVCCTHMHVYRMRAPVSAPPADICKYVGKCANSTYTLAASLAVAAFAFAASFLLLFLKRSLTPLMSS